MRPVALLVAIIAYVPAADLDLNALLNTMGAFEETFADSPRESIRRPTVKGGRAEAMSALQRGETSSSLAFDGVLGKGGMGTVHLAEQRSLGRNVAVKRLHDGVGNEVHSDALLSEGWIMGALEHPNIPPVHDAMLDDNGSPMLLLKRIEGQEWTELMGDEEAVRRRFGESLLEWNLGVLDAVCNALSYAHSKDIVHRDLKPENIMIGAFGEVYVLDWGLAAALHRDPNGRLPYIGDSVQPAGTPCFMAPELLLPDARGVDARTDVYLIGAVLYEALTGKPPHTGKSMRAVTESILRSEPSFPERAPSPLVDICRKAMQATPSERYASVEELQQALRHYQQRRASLLLTEKAYERVAKIKEFAAQPLTEDTSSEMFSLFSECRFAFRQVLASYPEDEAATTGINEVTELMAHSALSLGQLDAAKTFLRDLAHPTPELMQALAEVTSRENDKRERLKRLERQQDSDVGKNSRIIIVAFFAAIMTGGSLAGEVVKNVNPESLLEITVFWQLLLLVTFVVGFRRVGLEETENNRLTHIIISTALIGQVLATTTSWATGFTIEVTMLIDSAVWVTASLIAVLAMGRIYVPTVLGYTVCMVIIAWKPDYTYYGIAIGNVVMALNAGITYILKIMPKPLVSNSD